MMKHAKIVITESLNDLRDKKESQFNWMLLHHSVGILQDQWFTVITSFE
jgi:hypothetical protein